MAGTWAWIGLLAGSIAFAQQQQQAGQDAANRRQIQQGETQGQIPQPLRELNLSQEQEEAIRRIIWEHDQKLTETWEKFHAKHMGAVQMQAAWTAAVRDTLSREDQQKFDQQRLQDQEIGQYTEEERPGRGADPQQRQQRRETREQFQQDRQEARQRAREALQERSGHQSAQRHRSERDAQDIELVVIRIISPEKYTTGANQTEEQQQRCSEACREYLQKLTSTWRDLHRLHAEMVRIEADKLNAIEQELTEEQLQKLREGRRQPQETAEATSGKSEDRPTVPSAIRGESGQSGFVR